MSEVIHYGLIDGLKLNYSDDYNEDDFIEGIDIIPEELSLRKTTRKKRLN